MAEITTKDFLTWRDCYTSLDNWLIQELFELKFSKRLKGMKINKRYISLINLLITLSDTWKLIILILKKKKSLKTISLENIEKNCIKKTKTKKLEISSCASMIQDYSV